MKKIPNNITNIINQFIKGVNEILENRVKKVILFGSYAKNTPTKDEHLRTRKRGLVFLLDQYTKVHIECTN